MQDLRDNYDETIAFKDLESWYLVDEVRQDIDVMLCAYRLSHVDDVEIESGDYTLTLSVWNDVHTLLEEIHSKRPNGDHSHSMHVLNNMRIISKLYLKKFDEAEQMLNDSHSYFAVEDFEAIKCNIQDEAYDDAASATYYIVQETKFPLLQKKAAHDLEILDCYDAQYIYHGHCNTAVHTLLS